jgi:hypothetical protein
MVGDYTVSDIYQGGYSSLNPDYGSVFTGYMVGVDKLGTPTGPPGESGDVITNLNKSTSTGQKVVELSVGLDPVVIDTIPKQHLDEVNRLAKLTGVDVTIHAPLIDASGVTQQGFEDQQREIAERKIISVLEKSHQINPSGNVPVTFHTADKLPGARYSKTKERDEHVEFMTVVNQEDGQISGVKRDEKIIPRLTKEGEIIKEMYEVDKKIKIMNDTKWDESLQQLIIPKEHADRILAETAPLVAQIPVNKKGEPIPLEGAQKDNLSRFRNAHEQLRDVNMHLNSIFERAYKYGTEPDKTYLKKTAENFQNSVKNGDVINYSKALQGFMEDLRPGVHEDKSGNKIEFNAPQVLKSAEKYALEKSHETFGNAAWQSYKKFGDKAPIISIENPPAGMGLSRAKDVKNMVKGAREQFINNAVNKGMSQGEAKKKAEKLIGATWDVGHINQLRQFGFSSEDIIKEAEEIAPYVKHVHLSDNFGMENTELPPGMGNVDFKEVMEKLGKKGKDAKKIVEAFHWFQSQKSSPFAVSLEALGSPMYSMNMGPYWNQSIGLQQGYFEGPGMMLPPIHYETFGAGFSQLPTELGGQRQGGGGRMSGRPME